MAAYLESASLVDQKHTPLFRTTRGKTRLLTERRLSQPEVYLMIRRRASGAGIKTLIGCHTFRATGITAYLTNGGKLEVRPHRAKYHRHADHRGQWRVLTHARPSAVPRCQCHSQKNTRTRDSVNCFRRLHPLCHVLPCSAPGTQSAGRLCRNRLVELRTNTLARSVASAANPSRHLVQTFTRRYI